MAAVGDQAAAHVVAERPHGFENVRRAAAIATERENAQLQPASEQRLVLRHVLNHRAVVAEHAVQAARSAVDALVLVEVEANVRSEHPS